MENPVIACAVPIGRNTQIVIVDGHHRVRYSSGEFNVRDIPCRVYSPRQLIQAFNARFPQERWDEETLVAKLIEDVREAMETFGALPMEKHPKFVPNVSDPNMLPFKPFVPIAA